MLIYLDNCCYNRPYDNQSYVSIFIESQAKLFIQEQIKKGKIELVTSYVLFYENSQNPFEIRKNTIENFASEYETVYVSKEKHENVIGLAEKMEKTGIKHKDACHIACAILANCDFFITTDYRLLKYKTDLIKIINPTDFIKELEAE